MTASTTAAVRMRTRLRLGVLAGAALCVTPLAIAPSAFADGGPLGGLGATASGTITSIPHTISYPLGDPSDRNGGPEACDGGISPVVTCAAIDPLDAILYPNPAKAKSHKAKAKATKSRKALR
jgi:hypothetical protein